MNTLHLHGALKKRFGGPFTLDVKTAAEAVHALAQLLPGFREAVEAGPGWRVVRGALRPAQGQRRGRSLALGELGTNLGGELHLVAAPRGRKNGGGTGKIIIGAALIAVAAFFTFGGGAAVGLGAMTAAEAGAAGATVGLGTTVGTGLSASVGVGFGLTVGVGQIGLMGAAMLFAGVSQALSPRPKSGGERQDPRASYLFNGQWNQAGQGMAKPVGFGRMRVPGIVISYGIDTVDVPT